MLVIPGSGGCAATARVKVPAGCFLSVRGWAGDSRRFIDICPLCALGARAARSVTGRAVQRLPGRAVQRLGRKRDGDEYPANDRI